MKKLFIGALIALTTISFVACGNNAQSSNNTAAPVQNAEEEAVTQSESVLYSDDNITITCNGWKEDELWGTYLDITVENHSDKNICVMLEDEELDSIIELRDDFYAFMRRMFKNYLGIGFVDFDDLSEEEYLRNQFPDKIISNRERNLSRDSISGIQDAMLDLYCLAATTKIIGSFFSSFTDIAADMHQIPKIIAGE